MKIGKLHLNFINIAANCARFVARPSTRNWKEYSGRQYLLNIAIGIAIASIIALGLANSVLDYVKNVPGAEPDIIVPATSWLVSYSSETPCDKISACLHEPGPLNLWDSKFSVADSDYLSKVRNLQGQKFWVGLKLNRGLVHRMLSQQLSSLVIGHINAGFSIFVNGDLRTYGNGSDYLPVSVNFGKGDLNGGSEIKIVVEITHNLGSAFPFTVNTPFSTGLFSQTNAKNFRDRWIYLLVIKPLALALTGALAAIIFIGLWINVRDRNEFLIFGLFAFCLCGAQLMAWGNIKHSMDRNVYYKLDLLLMIFEGVFAGFLGAAYARTRLTTYFFFIAAGIICGEVSLNSAQLGSDFKLISSAVGKIFVPACFWLGSALCASQALFGSTYGFKGMGLHRQKSRIDRLKIFSILLSFLEFIYFHEAFKILSIATINPTWIHSIQFLVIIGIGIFLFSDFRDFDILQEKGHRSKFHDPLAIAGKTVTGYLLDIDMKESSRLYDLSSELGHAKEIPSIWNEGAIQIISGAGGEILSTEGDAFRAFFEHSRNFQLSDVVGALSKIKTWGRALENCGFPIEFRATLVAGGIRPIYKELSGKLYEDYEHAPKETCFKDASRYLREEKKQKFSGSILVIEANLLRSLSKSEHGVELIKTEKLLVDDVGQKELSFYKIYENNPLVSGETAA